MQEEQEEEYFDNEIDPELKIFRLHEGTDLVALCIDNTDDMYNPHYSIEYPLIMSTYKDKKSGKMNVAFTAWWNPALVDKDQSFEIHAGNILMTAEPSEQAIKAYFNAYAVYYKKKTTPKVDPDKVDPDKVTKAILETMDRLEPSIKGNKVVKKQVSDMFKRLRQGG